YAVLVGINSYPEQPLRGCVRDVAEIGKYLEHATSRLKIQTFVTTESVDKDSTTHPTYRNVTFALRAISLEAKAGDYVYIHFSGHGTKIEPDDDFSNKTTGDLALVLLDTRDDDSVTYLTGATLARYYLDPMVRKGLVVTLVLDCCFSASVYRRDGAAVRFLPYNARNDLYDPEIAELLGPEPASRAGRNASMQKNWLMDPDGYAILTACGPNEEGGEIILESGEAHGKLSYFLRRSFSGSGGCSKPLSIIFQYLCAEFRGHAVRQNPVLYGNKDQAFFGDIVLSTNSSLQAIRSSNGELRLLAGRAHGFCQGDRFELTPSACHPALTSRDAVTHTVITRLGGLTSILAIEDATLDESQVIWDAIALTQLRLRDYPIYLHPNLPMKEHWKEALVKQRVSILKEDDSQRAAFHITPGESGDSKVRDEQERLVVTPLSPTRDGSFLQSTERIEHMTKFALVKDLVNDDCTESFRKQFDVHITTRHNQLSSGAIVAVRHKEDIRLILRNYGTKSLFFTIYDMRPSWEVCNLLRASHKEIPPPKPGDQCFQQSIKITMEVPEWVIEKGLQACDDFIKVFVTPESTLFDSLELPKLGEAKKKTSPNRNHDKQYHLTSLEQEDWAALTFHIHVSLS
ncbi:hypothetical protein CC86DRAFT_237332, partial [Ophiobolus disseminans]